jgi:hypothetical protein
MPPKGKGKPRGGRKKSVPSPSNDDAAAVAGAAADATVASETTATEAASTRSGRNVPVYFKSADGSTDITFEQALEHMGWLEEEDVKSRYARVMEDLLRNGQVYAKHPEVNDYRKLLSPEVMMQVESKGRVQLFGTPGWNGARKGDLEVRLELKGFGTHLPAGKSKPTIVITTFKADRSVIVSITWNKVHFFQESKEAFDLPPSAGATAAALPPVQAEIAVPPEAATASAAANINTVPPVVAASAAANTTAADPPNADSGNKAKGEEVDHDHDQKISADSPKGTRTSKPISVVAVGAGTAAANGSTEAEQEEEEEVTSLLDEGFVLCTPRSGWSSGKGTVAPSNDQSQVEDISFFGDDDADVDDADVDDGEDGQWFDDEDNEEEDEVEFEDDDEEEEILQKHKDCMTVDLRIPLSQDTADTAWRDEKIQLLLNAAGAPFPFGIKDVRKICVDAMRALVQDNVYLKLKGPVNVVGDLHGNYTNLRSAVELGKRQRVVSVTFGTNFALRIQTHLALPLPG